METGAPPVRRCGFRPRPFGILNWFASLPLNPQRFKKCAGEASSPAQPVIGSGVASAQGRGV